MVVSRVSRSCRVGLFGVLLLGLSPSVLCGGFSPQELEFFEREVRPVLAEHCYPCHSAGAEKLKAGLFLDHRDGVLASGDSGGSVVPGDLEKSLLLTAVRYDDPDYEMPPKYRLNDSEIEALERWVEMGAPWPDEARPESAEGQVEEFDLEARRAEHWCWQPIEEVEVPVGIQGWGNGPIDAFVAERLEAAGLRPADQAEDRDWLRRVHFDLVGLPPTRAEISAFLEDNAATRRERVVDRLLASPHFGERWARHWMDLVRYGESCGHEFDFDIEGPHEYRDYLIRAFNADLPYDQLLREHVAGDLLEDSRRHPEEGFDEAVLATGFWYLGEAVHGPTDVKEDECDRIDNMIDVFSKTFLGLTVSCARCHDHKFDAISDEDYYALQAYFHATRRHHVAIDRSNGSRDETVAALRNLQQEAGDAFTSNLPKPSPETAIRKTDAGVLFDLQGGVPYKEQGWFVRGEAFGESPLASAREVSLATGRPQGIDGVADSGHAGAGLHGTLRSPNFVIESDQLFLRLRGRPGGQLVRVVIDGYFQQERNALLFNGTHLEDKGVGTSEKGAAWEWKLLGSDLRKYRGHVAYLELVDRGDGFVALDEVRSSSGQSLKGSADPQTLPVVAGWEEGMKGRRDALESALPKLTYAPGVDAGPVEASYLHVRGNPHARGEALSPRFLTALGGAADRAPGRRELVGEILAESNPLVSRVIVNRLWHHLFGRGIVATVDDFGVMGQAPSHPELLDWLAADLRKNRWSLKAAIRKIVLSETYGQAASAHPEVDADLIAEVDPENILLHRARNRRLSSEAIRDAVLAVSGGLDREFFGPPVPVHLTSSMEGRGRPKKSGPLDGAGRRSVYIAIRRNFLAPFQLAFDMPSPFSTMGRRSVSNVPAQSLTLLNDPFILGEARRWAKRVLGEEGAPEERLQRMFEDALTRLPSVAEEEEILAFLGEQPGLEDWTDVAHVIFNMKESIFLR